MSVRAPAALILALLIVPVLPMGAEGSQAPSSSAIVNSGHRGAVLDIAFDDAQNLLFSVGEDGTLRLWNPAAPALVRSLAVTHLKARMLAVNPSRSQAAFVATDDIGAFSLEVWDWKTGKRLYRLPLREQPLFVRYSGLGGLPHVRRDTVQRTEHRARGRRRPGRAFDRHTGHDGVRRALPDRDDPHDLRAGREDHLLGRGVGP